MNQDVDEARADRYMRWALCLERARDGDRDALTDVVRELNPLLWHVARAQGLDTESAMDVVQTTWLELVRALHDIHTPQALTAWIVATARRCAWRTQQRQRRLPVDSDDHALARIADPDPGPVERLVTDERDRTLLLHFARLPERCQRLLRLVAMVERADYDAVAEALEMPRGSIGPTRGRCLAKLREMLVNDRTWSAS